MEDFNEKMANKEEILVALDEFCQAPTDKIPEILEVYLKLIATTGKTLFPWSRLKPLFLKKMDLVMKNFNEDIGTDHLPPPPNVEHVKFEELRQRILKAVRQFNGAPFTIQRIAELMTTPRKYYQRPDKFMRGIEKNVNVVSAVDPQGVKIVHEPAPLENGLLSENGKFSSSVSGTPDRNNSIIMPPPPANSPAAVPGWFNIGNSEFSPTAIWPSATAVNPNAETSTSEIAATSPLMDLTYSSLKATSSMETSSSPSNATVTSPSNAKVTSPSNATVTSADTSKQSDTSVPSIFDNVKSSESPTKRQKLDSSSEATSAPGGPEFESSSDESSQGSSSQGSSSDVIPPSPEKTSDSEADSQSDAQIKSDSSKIAASQSDDKDTVQSSENVAQNSENGAQNSENVAQSSESASQSSESTSQRSESTSQKSESTSQISESAAQSSESTSQSSEKAAQSCDSESAKLESSAQAQTDDEKSELSQSDSSTQEGLSSSTDVTPPSGDKDTTPCGQDKVESSDSHQGATSTVETPSESSENQAGPLKGTFITWHRSAPLKYEDRRNSEGFEVHGEIADSESPENDDKQNEADSSSSTEKSDLNITTDQSQPSDSNIDQSDSSSSKVEQTESSSPKADQSETSDSNVSQSESDKVNVEQSECKNSDIDQSEPDNSNIDESVAKEQVQSNTDENEAESSMDTTEKTSTPEVSDNKGAGDSETAVDGAGVSSSTDNKPSHNASESGDQVTSQATEEAMETD